jgi:ribose 5-phosphate isomerase B
MATLKQRAAGGAARRTPRNLTCVKVVLGSDERTALTDAVRADLEARGAEVVLVGPPAGDDQQWAEVGRRVGEAVASGAADTGVLFCWTGTGASIAANKVPGVRAALATDAQTAAGARKWNDANVLVMSLRLTTPDVAHEMLDAWFSTDPDPSEAANIARLES